MTSPSLQFRPAGHPPAPPLTLDDVRRFTLRHRRLLLYCTAGAATLALSWALLRPRTYVSSASFTPQARRLQGGLSGLAAQLGANLPLGDANQSPAFYADLVTSRLVLGSMVDAPLDSASQARTLVEVYDIGRGTPAARRERAIERLARDVQVGVSTRTGVVRVSVAARSAGLAFELNELLLKFLNRYNLEYRQSQATAERDFTERRLAEARADLRESEERLQSFLLGNREARTPVLVIQEQRLRRAVSERQAAVAALVQAYEQARIDAVRDTPVISLIEAPNLPARPARRWALASLLVGAMLGLLAGILAGAVLDRLVVPPPAGTG
ncbi:MAG: lipopolysaccharide biosynthesis protein [Gemmatimonadetes bacterium]|nr:lipopolysaccharide biosynthesis protein [Gemmatimonadota bacterium]